MQTRAIFKPASLINKYIPEIPKYKKDMKLLDFWKTRFLLKNEHKVKPLLKKLKARSNPSILLHIFLC